MSRVLEKTWLRYLTRKVLQRRLVVLLTLHECETRVRDALKLVFRQLIIGRHAHQEFLELLLIDENVMGRLSVCIGPVLQIDRPGCKARQTVVQLPHGGAQTNSYSAPDRPGKRSQ